MSIYIKFGWIAFCFLLALAAFFRRASDRDWALTAAGMGFTLLADFFLVLHDNQLPGLAAFIPVHALYCVKALPLKNKSAAVIPVLLSITAAAFCLLSGALLAAAGLYAGLFILDIAVNARNLRRGPNPLGNRLIMLSGLCLFALCDINVLLYNLPRYIEAPLWLSRAGYTMIWAFYAPSQLLLALSAVKFKAGAA